MKSTSSLNWITRSCDQLAFLASPTKRISELDTSSSTPGNAQLVEDTLGAKIRADYMRIWELKSSLRVFENLHTKDADLSI